MKFGYPPLMQTNRALVEERHKEVAASGGLQETLTVEWRGQTIPVPVISMPVKNLYYNPATRRVKAQRAHDPLREKGLEGSNAWSPESQDYLQYLLQALPADPSKRDPDFDELKESLRDFKQTEPGLITKEGVLVNGNTRCAALRELGVPDIRVGVLPDSCTWDDIDAVELSLQLRPDHRRDYSYINKLLAMDGQRALGKSIEDIARDFRIRKATCEQDLWILACLRDLVDRSKNGKFQLRLLDFEKQQEKLRELHRKYMSESAGNRDNADLMKENRLLAIAMDFSKTDIRYIDHDFRERYLDKLLPEKLGEKLEPQAVAEISIPGLNRTVRPANHKVSEAKALTDEILQMKAVETAGEAAGTHELTTATSNLVAVKAAIEEALEPAGKSARIRKKKLAAPQRILDAVQDIEQCTTDVVLARASRSLDQEVLDEALLKLREGMSKLAVEISKSIATPGDGISWLFDATQLGQES
ncbi:transcriptional regulator [Nonomuraea sp. NPDC049655]|uniref:transcriptional regulator n=1 Tax=Nonomuraea sp. NPDC049655 TaxID=3364355 RepID=UPI00379D85BA